MDAGTSQERDRRMSYVDNVLQPGETVKVRVTIHWVTYLNGLIILAIAAAIFVAARQVPKFETPIDIIAVAVAALAGLLILRAWFHLWGTEIAVTDHRLIYKTGIIRRRTLEMNLDQIESVEVEQSILGRVLGYGDIAVHGTGEGTETIRVVADPLTVRSAITAR
jgi:uncharacterized membrane protein YdbT with pleckstrin-like domain